MRKVVDRKQPAEICADDVTEEMHLGVVLGGEKILYSNTLNGKIVCINTIKGIYNSAIYKMGELVKAFRDNQRFVFDDFTEALRWLLEDSNA